MKEKEELRSGSVSQLIYFWSSLKLGAWSLPSSLLLLRLSDEEGRGYGREEEGSCSMSLCHSSRHIQHKGRGEHMNTATNKHPDPLSFTPIQTYLYSILWAIITEKSRLVILFGSWAASFCSESWSFARPPICLGTQWWWNKVKKGWGVAMWRSQTIRFFIMSDRTQVSVSESRFLLTMLSAHNAVALITLLNYKMHWFNRQIKETEERAHCLFLSWRQSAWPGCYTDVGTSFRLHLGPRGWGRSWWLPSSWFLLACCSLVNLH